MLAGGRDLFQVVQHLFLIVDMGRSQRSEADDGVHGGADIVAHIEQELPLRTVCRPLVLECDLQLAVLFLQLSLILLLLFFLLLLHLLHGASAQHLKDHYKQDVTDQHHQNQRKGFPEDRSFIRIRIEIERSSMAVHSKIAAGAVPTAGMGQRFGGHDFADSLHQRTVCNILPDQLRAVGGNDLIVLHDEQCAAGLSRVAVQYTLDGQGRSLNKFCRGIAVGKQDLIFFFCPVCHNIHSRPIFQQDPLQVSLLRVRENIQNSVIFELFSKPGVADAVRCGFAQERTVRGQNRDPCEPALLRLLFQALRIGEVQRRVLRQLMHRHRCAAERFGHNRIVVLFKAGGLRFDKIKGLAETSLRCAQCPPTREKNDAGHKKHTDDQMEPPSPCIREGSVLMRQGCPPPDTVKHVQDICQGSAPACRLCASAQRYRSAGGPARGCRFWQRRRPAR